MITEKAIIKMFPEQGANELLSIWSLVFNSELSIIFGHYTFDPIKLEECLILQYGKFEGSLKDFIIKKFGNNVLNSIINI